MGRPGRDVGHRRGLPRGASLSADDIVDRLRAAGCVYAEDEARVLRASGRTGVELEEWVVRRVAGEPLETIVGWVSFGGRRLAVAPGVFVPRRRTELLVRLASQHCHRESVLVELCCGVAPVASLVHAGNVHAADISDAAIACARANAPRASIHHGDLYAALPSSLRGHVDVLAANAPYVPSAAIGLMPPEAREHEPLVALDGGRDGVDVHRRIVAEATQWLRSGGVLLIETGTMQAGLTTAAMASAGLRTHVVHDEEIGGCVAVGRWDAAGI